MSSELGVLLVGYGLAGRVFHAPLIQTTPGMRIRAVVTADPGRQGQVREDLPEARIVANIDDAWADDIDLVVIASANRTHVPIALEAIARGTHVVIDKPVAGSAAEAERVLKAAQAAGVQVHPFQNRRWDSDFMTLRQIAESGELGRIHRFESRIERMRVQPRGTWRESADPDDLGGVLLDFGSHLVDQAIELLGPVRAVDAHVRSVRHADGANDDAVLILTHTSGVLSTIIGSQAAAFGEPRFVLFGTRGGVRIEQSDTQEAALRAGRTPADAGWGLESFTAQVRTFDDESRATDDFRELVPGDWGAIYSSIRDAVLTGAPGPVPFAHAIANLRVLDAARESAESGSQTILSEAAAHG